MNRGITILLICVATLTGCTGIPTGVTPVDDFEVERYLGTWYEIARLDNRFERGLTHVTAEYALRDDGGLEVVNSGWSSRAGERVEAVGRAYFVDAQDRGHLKVSFFGPFFASYVIFELDANYRYAFVSGNDHDLLWLLAREPEVDADVIERFRARSEALGFDTEELLLVPQTGDPQSTGR